MFRRVNKNLPVELLLWNIAFPGFGQIRNGRIVKGLAFIVLEFLINVNANINEVIALSFNGHIREAIQATNYEWILFYPCIYVFSMWDAYKDGGGGSSTYAFLPAVFSAYIGTLGVVFSREAIFGLVLLGPIWLGICGMFFGAGVGYLIKLLLVRQAEPRRWNC